MSKTNNFVLMNSKKEVVAQLGREKPGLRKLAKEYGHRCEKEGLAVYRVEVDTPHEGVALDKFVLVGELREEKNVLV